MGKLEELKQKILKLKNKNKTLSKDDTKTIQAHKDVNGELRDYYISDYKSESKAKFTSVVKIKEDYEKHIFIYQGVVLGANNAIGILESNIPLDEMVSNLEGNLKFQEMLSEEYASMARDTYYKKIGESLELPENHYTYFTKPTFALGTFLRLEDGHYTFKSEISNQTEEMLKKEREEAHRKEMLTNKDFVNRDFGGGMVQAIEDCWMNQEKNGFSFNGINKDALYYQYKPFYSQKIEDKYVYIGTVQLGEATSQKESKVIQIMNPYVFPNVVLWTERKNLIEYFMEEKYNNLNFTLGEMLTNEWIENSKKGLKEQSYIGGLVIDENGLVKNVDTTPEVVKEFVETYLEQKTQIKIIDLASRKK